MTFSSADLVARYHNIYRDQARQYGYEAAADQLGWACPIYVADTDERAREEAGRAVESLFNDFLRQTFEMLMPPGYTSIGSMKNFISMRRALGGGKADRRRSDRERHRIDRQPQDGVGRHRADARAHRLRHPGRRCCQFGILSDDLTRRNMDIFAAEVMPHLRD